MEDRLLRSEACRGCAAGIMAIVLALPACSGEPAMERTEVLLLRGAALDVPAGWTRERQNNRTVLRPADAPDVRLEIASVALSDPAVERSLATVADAVRVQVRHGTGGAPLRRDETARPGTWPAHVLEWSYSSGGKGLTRRHWVILLPAAFVHVGCVGPAGQVPTECDPVAASLRPARGEI